MSFTIYRAGPVLDLIGKYEGRSDYDTVWNGIPISMRPDKLTANTVAQVMQWQAWWRSKGLASTAAGKYQIISTTLKDIVSQMRFDTSRKFDAATQDTMACHLLTGRGFQRFLDGKIDSDDMAIGLAKEWASLPVPHDMQGASRKIKAGQSYYAGDGLNAAHASIAEVKQALAIARERYQTGSGPVPAPAAPAKSSSIATVIIAIAAALVAYLGLTS
ncbi:lysozyme family protein [Paracoccus onubensis]|uniref:Glycoside hydrolase family 104 protein n=1 Tax=Paracoccus onubensis TaxID=1675788 RepID=A0A418SZN3_9RHOB|nr:hypothetical protein [Paracoccus onubensis]RJE86399.1 hypothetical protein D3P04_06600 [Paracoccus onubensis]